MSLLQDVLDMPTKGVALPSGMFVRYRETLTPTLSPRERGLSDSLSLGERAGVRAGTPTTLVLLHGIGSGSGSWVRQLQSAGNQRIIAWDAPGYADSTAIKIEAASTIPACDYAQILWQFLDELGIEQVHLVGHSLGCLMAAAAANLQPERIVKLTLLSPARGYGTASHEIQTQKINERMQAMQNLGLQKMAEQRAPRLLSKNASPENIELAIHMMSHLNEGGYEAATRMLSSGDILNDLQAFQAKSTAKISVACGSEDIITPPAACAELALKIKANYIELAGAGHLCALEASEQVNSILGLK